MAIYKLKRKLFNVAAIAKAGGNILSKAGLGGGKVMGAINIGTIGMTAVAGKKERAANEETMSAQLKEQQDMTKKLQNIANS